LCFSQTGTFHDGTHRYSMMPSRSNKDGLLDIDGRPLDGDTEVSLVQLNGTMHSIAKHIQSAAAVKDHVLSLDGQYINSTRMRGNSEIYFPKITPFSRDREVNY